MADVTENSERNGFGALRIYKQIMKAPLGVKEEYGKLKSFVFLQTTNCHHLR